jgi:hypothetical protein
LERGPVECGGLAAGRFLFTLTGLKTGHYE